MAMDYAEASKKVGADKPKENLMLIEVAYDKKLLLPYKDGVAFMAAFSNAELLIEEYGTNTRIGEIDKHSVRCAVFSSKEYQRIKIAALLGMSPDEVKQYETPQKESSP
jgi:hypothetical protein